MEIIFKYYSTVERILNLNEHADFLILDIFYAQLFFSPLQCLHGSQLPKPTAPYPQIYI